MRWALLLGPSEWWGRHGPSLAWALPLSSVHAGCAPGLHPLLGVSAIHMGGRRLQVPRSSSDQAQGDSSDLVIQKVPITAGEWTGVDISRHAGERRSPRDDGKTQGSFSLEPQEKGPRHARGEQDMARVFLGNSGRPRPRSQRSLALRALQHHRLPVSLTSRASPRLPGGQRCAAGLWLPRLTRLLQDPVPGGGQGAAHHRLGRATPTGAGSSCLGGL